VSFDSSIAHGGYVGARIGLVEAQNKIIRNKTIKKTFLFLIKKSNKKLKIQKFKKKQ